MQISRNKSSIPFVGLHAHSVGGSPFDALGYVTQHMNFAYGNGMDAFAITEHGNMNSLAEMVIHAKKMQKDGKEFKPIFGVEAYFIPSVANWKEEYEEVKSAAKNKSEYEVEQSGTTVENEASKKKMKSVLNRRRHLILLAQNQEGLQNIFKMISTSYVGDNFYRYPRVDYALLKKHNKGVIAASACLTGDSILDTSMGQMRLDDVVRNYKEGNELFVLSYSEKEQRLVYRRVLWGDLTRKKAQIIRIKTKDGKSVRLTPDHKVFTDQGWVEAGDLKKHKNIKILSLK